MKYSVYSQSGEKTGETLLPKAIFEVKVNSDLLHQVVVGQMANQRQVGAHTKTRREVRGGGKKPWRQKGTGRARHASIRSPLWRGGGTVFGPTKEKIYRQKINKKMQKLALLMALSAKAKDQELLVLDALDLKSTKTKEAFQIIENLKKKLPDFKKGKILFVLPERNQNVLRSTRNIPNFKLMEARNINALVVLSGKYLLLTKETISALKKFLLKKQETE
jgi:large subunit ribosomal protein L4